MANYNILKQAIQDVIRTNGNNEITGALLQQSLLAMINSLGAGYQFVGVATPATNPGTPDQKIFYLASQDGTYPNFGNIAIENEVAILSYDTTWHKLDAGIKKVTISKNTQTGGVDIKVGGVALGNGNVASQTEFSGLENKISDVQTNDVDTTYTSGYINAQGGVTSSSYAKHSNFVAIEDDAEYVLHTNASSAWKIGYYSSNSEASFISAQGLETTASTDKRDYVCVIPPNAKYLRVSISTTSGNTFKVTKRVFLDIKGLDAKVKEHDVFIHGTTSGTLTLCDRTQSAASVINIQTPCDIAENSDIKVEATTEFSYNHELSVILYTTDYVRKDSWDLPFNGVINIPRVSYPVKRITLYAQAAYIESAGRIVVTAEHKIKGIDERFVDEQGNIANVANSITRNHVALHDFYAHRYIYHYAPNAFIRDGQNRKAIPSESLYDVEMAARLGFPFIEANVHKTSDGKYICIHGNNDGTFGPEVQSEYSSLMMNECTLEFIKTNIRYASEYTKYQGTIPTLEEFCVECKKNGIGVDVGSADLRAIRIAHNILGDAGVILYNAPTAAREFCKGYITEWLNTSDITVESLIAHADNYGNPYISFLGDQTITKLKNEDKLSVYLEEMHKRGYLCGFAAVYQTEEEARELFGMGFDVASAGHEVEDFDANYEIIDLNDANPAITTTGNMENGVLTLEAGQTATFGSTDVKGLVKCILRLLYKGSISITFGSAGLRELSSTSDEYVTISDFCFKRATNVVITAGAHTEIKTLLYKTSVC